MSLRRSFLFAFSGRYASLALNFLATIILARLVTPEDIGIFSIAMAFVSVAHTLRDFGTSQYLIQAKELEQAHIRAALTVAASTAYLLVIAIYMLSDLCRLALGEKLPAFSG